MKKRNITLKKLMLGSVTLLSAIGIFSLPSYVSASTSYSHAGANSTLASQMINTSKIKNVKTQGNLPLDTPLLLKGFSYSGGFLGYLGLTTSLTSLYHWNYLYMDTSYTEIYLEDAGNGKVYMRAAKPDWEGYEFVSISSRGYLYLGTKEVAEPLSVITENDPTKPAQKMYEFLDSHNRAIGVYDKYITVGSGTNPVLWKVIP